MARIHLSPPDVGQAERLAVDRAIRSGWVAPVGPELDLFESEVAEASGRLYGVGVSSGTAALHLALIEAGVKRGDDVVVPTFTFAATANAVSYCGARPVLLDSDSDTWNISADLLSEELMERARLRSLPAAVITVDLYGLCAAYETILPICAQYGIPVIEDAAEAIGSSVDGSPAGSFGVTAIFSFNGNKIITTSGGGMLVTDNERIAEGARYLASQARDPAPHYEHSKIGYNYRLSNVLAAIGRVQLAALSQRVEARRAVNRRYREALKSVPGISFQEPSGNHHSNCWLTCISVDAAAAGASAHELRLLLDANDIEARPTWKPMHMQPVYASAPHRVDGTSERLFRTGLCLPSGSALSISDQSRIIDLLLSAVKS